MDIASLNISLVRQEPKSDDCLRCCAQMIFSYFKDPISKDEIWKKLHVYKKHSGLYGAYFQDFGKIALKRNYKAEIHHCDWHWWNKDVVTASSKNKKSLLKELSTLKSEKKEWADKRIVNKEILFTKLGGKFNFQIPKLETIDKYLLQKIPVILIVSAEDFFQSPKEKYSHSVLVIGKKDNNYIIRDPLHNLEETTDDELIYSWSRAGGWLMAIIPNPSKKSKQKTQSEQSQLL